MRRRSGEEGVGLAALHDELAEEAPELPEQPLELSELVQARGIRVPDVEPRSLAGEDGGELRAHVGELAWVQVERRDVETGEPRRERERGAASRGDDERGLGAGPSHELVLEVRVLADDGELRTIAHASRAAWSFFQEE